MELVLLYRFLGERRDFAPMLAQPPAGGRTPWRLAAGAGGHFRRRWRIFPSPLANISVAAGEYFRRHRGVFLRGNNVSSLRPRAWRHRRQSERRQRPASH